MSLFGIGGNKSSTQSQEQSIAQSSGSSFSQTNQSVFGSDLFQQLYGDAFGASAKVAANLPTYQGDAAALFSGGTDFLDQLHAGDAGSDYLTGRLSGPDTVLDSQIGALSSDLGKFWNETLMPGITGEGVANNNLGGSRNQLAVGTGAGEVARQFTQGVTQLRSSAQNARDSAAGVLTNARTAQAATGLQSLPNILGIAQAGATSSFLPQQLLAQILGGPTTLTSALSGASEQSTSNSWASSRGKSGGFSFGIG